MERSALDIADLLRATMLLQSTLETFRMEYRKLCRVRASLPVRTESFDARTGSSGTAQSYSDCENPILGVENIQKFGALACLRGHPFNPQQTGDTGRRVWAYGTSATES